MEKTNVYSQRGQGDSTRASSVETAAQALHTSPLFVGLTRPAMRCGVTFDYLGVTALATMCTVILMNNPLWGFLYLPLHGFGAIVCWFDPFAFVILMKRSAFAYMPNKTLWGCVSYAPY